jgi:nicotinate phosphoribosyltransferase
MKLPKDHRPYTDKYFLRTNEILNAERLNPEISMKVFARGSGKVAGLNEAIEVLEEFSDLANTGEVWVTQDEVYQNKDPLMIIKGPAQSFAELETMYLGVLSAAITSEAGIVEPNMGEVKEKFERLVEIYQDMPITYFGARHYHWCLDEQIAKAALEGGAIQTSTDIGSGNIGLKGVGTTPHLLTIILADKYGIEDSTLKTAQLFDKHMDSEIPRVTLVDTFNRELTDSLAVAGYFGNRRNLFRIDTCGENIGEGGNLYQGKKSKDPSYQVGTGVTVELARNLRNNLIENGYGPSTDTFLSSSFGNEEKAKTFVKANQEFKAETGYDLFTGVGIGEVSEARFCTADIYEVDGKPFSKTGREVSEIDYTKLRRVL